jgi:hypothetical protein
MTKIDDEVENQMGEWFLPARSPLAYLSFGAGLILLALLAILGHLCLGAAC